MEKGWRGGLEDGTICGNGSTLANTAKIRAWLPELAERFNFVTINDAGAGDLHWIKRVQWQRPVAYRAFDLIPRTDKVTALDVTRDPMPTCDVILCRMVLNHLDPDRIALAIGLFRRRARYLLATQFDGETLPQRSPQFKRCDLRPLLGPPIEVCRDGPEPECRLALWLL